MYEYFTNDKQNINFPSYLEKFLRQTGKRETIACF